MESVYLVGQISTNEPITYKWREEVRKLLEMNKGFEVIDPCFNKFNTDILRNGEFKDKAVSTDTSGLIVPKDLSYVKRSSGCICDFTHYDMSKPILGSFFELAWYYQYPEKFVVGVLDGDPKLNYTCNHPFVKSTVDIWCKTHEEAAKAVIDLYWRFNS